MDFREGGPRDFVILHDRTLCDLEFETIRKREEFAKSSEEGLEWSDRERAVERKRQKAAEAAGEDYEPLGDNPVRISVLDHEARYPEERLGEIETSEAAARAEAEAARLAALHAPEYAVQALLGGDVDEVEASIIKRDRIDSSRDHSPLTETEDAITVDTTGMSVAEVVAHIVEQLA